MAKVRRLAICFRCGERPVRGNKFYCSLRCAAAEAINHASYAYDWCAECYSEGKDIGYGPGWRDAGHRHGRDTY